MISKILIEQKGAVACSTAPFCCYFYYNSALFCEKTLDILYYMQYNIIKERARAPKEAERRR
nr:MAG TPA: hypothetical protein [Caudoviricetes sp.]